MNAMRAAALPESRAAVHAGHYLEAGAENGTRTRPDLRLVPSVELSATAPATAGLAILPGQWPAMRTPASHLRADHPAPPLRLTRRGRIVVAAMAALLVAALSLVAAGAAQAISHTGSARPAAAGLARVIVRPGQSLWAVAESADPDADTRLVIQQITELNSLHGDTVFAGQRLWVPRS